MDMKAIIFTIGKLLIGMLAFMIGSIMGGMAAGMLGIPTPVMPANIDPAELAQSLPLVALLMTAALACISTQIRVGFFQRWMILSLFSWTVYGLNNYLEARFFSPEQATSFVLIYNLLACFTCSAAVALLFKPARPTEPFGLLIQAFLAARPAGSWTWRFLGGLAVFPVAYFVFGWLVSPFVVSYYQQQYAGLALPGMDVMLGLATVRSLLFLLCIFPLIVAWNGSRLTLFLGLSGALFLFVGGLNMLQAIWLPVTLRTAHSIEILADSIAHAAGLVFLLVPGIKTGTQTQPRTTSMDGNILQVK